MVFLVGCTGIAKVLYQLYVHCHTWRTKCWTTRLKDLPCHTGRYSVQLSIGEAEDLLPPFLLSLPLPSPPPKKSGAPTQQSYLLVASSFSPFLLSLQSSGWVMIAPEKERKTQANCTERERGISACGRKDFF